jgi:tetratricopeptide (TPR) repeat protein
LLQYRRELALSHDNLGRLLHKLGQPVEAGNAYREALNIQAQLVQEFPKMPEYHHDLAATMVHKAILLRQNKKLDLARRLLEEALPHHQTALQAAPGNVFYREFLRNNRWLLAQVLVDMGEHAAAGETAGQLIQAAVDPGNDIYNAACIFSRCVPLAGRDSRLAESERKEKAQAYADRALATLRQAVQNGYQDIANMKSDTDLDPLRVRPEFQKLLKDLEARPKAERK